MATQLQIDIQNINYTGVYNIGVDLELEKIAQKISKAVYNPSKFAAVIIKSLSTKATGLLFNSGKIVVSGCKREEDLKKSVEMIIKILNHIGMNIQYKKDEVKIRNITGTIVYPYGKISLEKFFFSHADSATYEPELFPGLIYRMMNPPIVYTIYVSGKIVINGAKSWSDFTTAVTVIAQELSENELNSYIKKNLIAES